MENISVIIHTKNSDKTIEKALKSVSWANDIVIMDMNSTDKTLEIAKKYHARVFNTPVLTYADPVRNLAISKAKYSWVFVLDADEEATPSLSKLLIEKSKQQEISGYYIPRKNMIFGQWAKTGWWPDYILRFFTKETANWPKEIHSQPTTSGRSEYLPPDERYAIVHNHYEDVSQFVDRMNRYTSIEADQRKYLHDSSFLEMGSDEFMRRFFSWKGYEQGTYGLALSLLQQCSYIISGIKKWEKAGFPKDDQVKHLGEVVKSIDRQYRYWIADMHVQNSESIVHNVYWKIRRKLKI